MENNKTEDDKIILTREEYDALVNNNKNKDDIIEAKQEERKDPYETLKKAEEEQKKVIKIAEENLRFENWIRDFKDKYNTLPENDIDKILNLENQTNEYKASKLIIESFKNNDLLEVLDSESMQIVKEYLNSSYEKQIAKAREMTKYIDKAVELDAKLRIHQQRNNPSLYDDTKSKSWIDINKELAEKK